MIRIGFLLGLALLLSACVGSPATRTEAACNAPPQSGETWACAYYSGYGWAHVPIYHGSAPGTNY